MGRPISCIFRKTSLVHQQCACMQLAPYAWPIYFWCGPQCTILASRICKQSCVQLQQPQLDRFTCTCMHQQEDLPMYQATYQAQPGLHLCTKEMKLHKNGPATPDPGSTPHLEMVAQPGWAQREAVVKGPCSTHICSIRKGSVFKLTFRGKCYRYVHAAVPHECPKQTTWH